MSVSSLDRLFPIERPLAHRLARLVDGPDVLRGGPCKCGTCRSCTTRKGSTKPAVKLTVAYARDDTTGKETIGAAYALHDDTAYRMRTQPELFDEAERNTILDWRASMADTADLYDWDCHKCHTAVYTATSTEPCPRCGHLED